METADSQVNHKSMTIRETLIAQRICYILRKFHTFEDIAIKSKSLCNSLGIKVKHPEAELCPIIAFLRRQGKPICSSTEGYWWNEKDVDECCISFESRAKKILKTSSAMKRNAVNQATEDIFGGQNNN